MRVKLEDVCERGSSNLKQSDVEDNTGNYPIYGAAGCLGNVNFYHQDKPYVAVVKDGAGIGRTTLHPAKSSVIGTMQYLIPKENILPEYLYYVVKHMHLEKYFTGATIPHIYYKDYKKEEFNLVDLKLQAEVVRILKKVEGMIVVRKQELEKLDTLIKSRFVEMFGDPIGNSMGLRTIPLGAACYLKAGITTSADAIHEYSTDYSIPCYGGNGIRGYVKEATQCGCYPIIGRQGALCGNIQLAMGEFHATEHAVLVTPLIEINVVWLFHLLKLMDLYRFHTGAAQPGLAVKTLNTVDIPIADIVEQDRFATFVRSIDKLKATIQKSIDEAQTLFDSLMQEYFG